MTYSINTCRPESIIPVLPSLPLPMRWMWAIPVIFARILALYDNNHAAIAMEISGATYTDEQIREAVKEAYRETGYLLDPHGACGYRALSESLQPGETGVFLETAHPAKFLETVEDIIGNKVEIPAKLKEFMKGVKQSIPMNKDF